MATKIVMEALSPTMEEGRLVKWTKHEGDAVASGDVLAEIETDKAIMELVARGAGILRKRLVGDGDTVPVGQLIGVIATADENIDAIVRGATSAPAAAPTPAAALAPAASALAAAPTPSPPASPPAPTSTPVVAQAVRTSVKAADSLAAAAPAGNAGRVRASPLARRLASERGVDLHGLAGSGPNGRIVRRDIEERPTPSAPAPAAAGPPAVPTSPPREGDFRDVPLTQIRKTIARRLAESLGPIPTFYLTAELDVERVSELRAAMAQSGDEYRVSVNDILLKAVATALVAHPEVNAHWLGDRIRQHHRVHLGMAVAIDDGLITPVLFDADRKSLGQIAREARALAAKARARTLTPAEYTGSTFSVSNLGMLGIDQFTAIINPPETAILAVGAVEAKPVVVDGAVAIRRRLRVTLSCDHRAVDGATGAKFLQTLRRLIENPLMLVF